MSEKSECKKFTVDSDNWHGQDKLTLKITNSKLTNVGRKYVG